MTFLGSILKLFSRNTADTTRKRLNPFVQLDSDPSLAWENVDVIGDGAFGKVHKARHKTDGRVAALKEIALESSEDLEDLKVEIDILVSCRHDYIVDLMEAYLFENRLWLYLEYCGGGALDSIMQDLCRPLSETEIRHVCHRVLLALVFLHSRFIIHRDLKAGNILLTQGGAVKLADFGVSAKNTDEKQRRDTFIGTPFWMAPEVITCETIKDNPYDYRADVWSLGITLIELAEMNPPHHEMHPMRLLIKVQRSPPPHLGRPKRWSAEFASFLKRCLVKDPSQRAASQDLVDDPFIADVDDRDNLPMRQLVLEVHGEYIDTVEEGVSSSVLHQSSISLGSLDKLTDGQETESNDSNPSSPISARRMPNLGSNFRSPKSPLLNSSESILSTSSAGTADVPSSSKSTNLNSLRSSTQSLLSSEITATPTDASSSATTVILQKETSPPQNESVKGSADLRPTSVTSKLTTSKSSDAILAQKDTPKSALVQTGAAGKATAPKPPVQTETVAKPPIPTETVAKPPVQTEIVAKPPVQTEIVAKPPVQIETVAKPPVQTATVAKPPVQTEIVAKPAVQTETVIKPPVQIEIVAKPAVQTTAVAKPAVQTTAVKNSAVLPQRPATTATSAPCPEVKQTPSVLSKPSGDVRRQAVQFEERAAELVGGKSSPALRPQQLKGSMSRLIQGFESMAKPPAPPVRSVSIKGSEWKSDPSLSSVGAEVKPAEPKLNHSPAKVSERATDRMEGLGEEILDSLLKEVLSSDINAPSVPFVVLDVMQEEFEASPPTPIGPGPADNPAEVTVKVEQDVLITDIDAIVVNDNRTKAEVVAEGESSGPVRIGGGFGTVSAIVANSPELEVRDNREGTTAGATAPAVNGQAEREDDSKANGETLTEAEEKAMAAKMSDRRRQSHFRTLTRTRKFVIDGEERTTTTTRVVVEGLETKAQEDYDNRKQGIREMRLLQKQEQRQHRDLLLRSQNFKSELDQRLRNEELALQRQYESELEVMQRQHKVQLERAEQEHTNEIRYSSRRVRASQDRELRQFRDSLKQEIKSVRQDVEVVPKDKRKEMLRQRMEEKELEHAERERDFHSKLAAQMSAEVDRMTVKHRQKLGQMEKNFLRLKHSLRRRYEEDRWRMEESHMYIRHQKAREQLEEYFSLKREQTANKQMIERNHLTSMISKDKAHLVSAQTAEKKRLPKALRTESKTRLQMFRQSLRVPGPNAPTSSEDERERIRVFEEAERERVRADMDRVNRKHAKKFEAMQLTHSTMQRELEQLQAEKKKELMDQEASKLREIEENFQRSMSEYQQLVKEKRQALDSELEEELRRQQEFYTLSDDGPNVQIRELPASTASPVTDLDSVPVSN